VYLALRKTPVVGLCEHGMKQRVTQGGGGGDFLNFSSVLTYIQQDTTLHSLFYLETALHVSGGTTTHHQERKQLYLQHLVFVTPLLLPAAIVEDFELV
jgi:hypothetical protein